MNTVSPSRPFRWLGLILIGWISVRAVTILAEKHIEPDVGLPSAATIPDAARGGTDVKTTRTPTRRSEPRSMHGPQTVGIPRTPIEAPHIIRTLSQQASEALATFEPRGSDVASRGIPFVSVTTAPSTATLAASDKRWSGSAWALLRRDGPSSLGAGGELGGSQAGVRGFYAIADPISITARISRPLARADGGEASVGVAFRHGNIGLLVERRIALDRGGRNDFSVTAYGGVSEIKLGHGVRIDGYAQAGVVGIDTFADGAVRLERTLIAIGKARVSAGAGAWGGAQPGARRVDLGPQIVGQVPFDGGTLRISAEWRERIAGDATPHSGPSVTIGADF